MTADPVVHAARHSVDLDAELITLSDFRSGPAQQGGSTALAAKTPPDSITDPLAVESGTTLEDVRKLAAEGLAGEGQTAEEIGPGAADRLTQEAAVSRPVFDVARFIGMLAESPGCSSLARDCLRTAAVLRPVEEVSELASLLSQPPHSPGAAEEAVWYAAAERPVAQVTELVVLLNQPPHHAGEFDAAVLSAAAARPVEDLAALIHRLHERGVTMWEPEPEPEPEPVEEPEPWQPRRRSWLRRP